MSVARENPLKNQPYEAQHHKAAQESEDQAEGPVYRAQGRFLNPSRYQVGQGRKNDKGDQKERNCGHRIGDQGRIDVIPHGRARSGVENQGENTGADPGCGRQGFMNETAHKRESPGDQEHEQHGDVEDIERQVSHGTGSQILCVAG